VTIFGLLFTPAFYVISRKGGDRVKAWIDRLRRRQGGEEAAL
jgi:hypothetical protein